jgi:hypothetical protein
MIRQRRTANPRLAKPYLEQLEHRTLLDAGVSKLFSPYDFAPASAKFDPVGFGGPFQSGPGPSLLASDPGAAGPYAVTEQSYDFGSAAYVPPQFGSPTGPNKIELTGEVYAPTDLSGGPFPLVVLMHGNHFSDYAGTSAFYEWPTPAGHLPLPNYLGYGYFATTLASNGYIVVSISANGVNVLGNNFAGTGMLGRGQLTERTLDIFNDLNVDGVVHTRPGDTSNFVDGQMPFGTRFVGAVNMQDVGLMGHSRGGEGVVQGYLVNQAAGAPYGINAVFAIAPVDFQSPTINNTNFAVLLPYNDGDVSDLQGAHFFDDSRYNVAGDTGAKYIIEVMGADHNFYNTVWSPGGGYPGASDDGNAGPPTRLTQTQQRGTGLAYMSAFFRTYLGGEVQFQPILSGDAPPPPSAQVTPDRIHNGYLPPDNPAGRRDINRLTAAANLTTNTLGGAVVTGGLASYTFTTGGGSGFSEPHRNLGQATIGYTGTTAAFWENDLPAGFGDESGFNDLQFRVGVNYGDARNPANTAQDFSVSLTDASGASYSVLVSAYSNNLFDPPTPAGNPHEVLNTVRIPLDAFVGQIDLGNVVSVRFNFDQHPSGAFQITDLAFADLHPAAGPFVVSSTPAGGVFAPQNRVRVTFNVPIDLTTFTTSSIDSFTRTVGSTVTDISSDIIGVTPVAGSNDRQFDITFNAQITVGVYDMVIGPNILDTAGNPMDQDHDLVAGQIPDDEYTATFVIQGPQVISSTPSGITPAPVDHVRVTFNEPIDAATFDTGQVALSDPSGNPISVNSVSEVPLTNHTQFDIMFAAQSAVGTYTLIVGPNIQDLSGNPMAAPFTGQFTLTNNQLQNGDFETGDFTGWTRSGNPGSTGVDGGNVHSGMFAAFLGPVGSEGFLAQSFSTTPGANYTLDYWLQHDGGSPSSFHAMIDGVDIPGSVLSNPPAFGYTEYTFTFTAAGSTTELKFGFREDPTYFHLDDVTVSPAPAPPPPSGGSGGGGGSAPLLAATSIPAPGKLTFAYREDPAYFHLVEVSVSPTLAPLSTPPGDFGGPARATGITIDQLDLVFALAAENGDDLLAVVSGGLGTML